MRFFLIDAGLNQKYVFYKTSKQGHDIFKKVWNFSVVQVVLEKQTLFVKTKVRKCMRKCVILLQISDQKMAF